MRNKSILTRGQSIDKKYRVAFFLKKGRDAETYRVVDLAGKTGFLKLFSYAKLQRSQFNNDSGVFEIDILKQIDHPNMMKYRDSGEVLLENKKYAYVVLDFISGETLGDKMKREHTLNPYDAKDIVLGVLNGLNYLHNLERPVIHNNITNMNVMSDLSGKTMVPKIIDFGYARYISQPNSEFMKDGLNPFYQANEAFNKVFSVQSDVFSVGALYYHLLFGLPPWFIDISRYKSDRIKLEDVIIEERKKPLKFVGSDCKIDDNILNIIAKALQPNAENRFSNVNEFTQALNGELEVELSLPKESSIKIKPSKTKAGKGFSAIAGMQELKDMIQLDVIDALNNKERYAEYGLTIPNGMLLYGPPGCGKTFFAEQTAQEIGFNFYQIKPSDVQSKWVNASQENVKNLFDEARTNAPSILFIDELDALVPNREGSGVHHMNSAVVNEFLAQMNNCGDDGVFVIGATNLPSTIDPAIMRAGRLDKKIYVSVPDLEARISIFKMYLKKRPIELGMSYNKLAEATKDYASVDIKFICDEAARQALKLKDRISLDLLLKTIKVTRPSSSLSDLKKYRMERDKLEGKITNERPRVGFN